jgi:hypothetical protein
MRVTGVTHALDDHIDIPDFAKLLPGHKPDASTNVSCIGGRLSCESSALGETAHSLLACIK